MQMPVWMEQCYWQMKALQFEYLDVSGFLLGKQQRREMERFLREQEALQGATHQFESLFPLLMVKGDRLWGKPVVWSDAADCAVPVTKQGATVVYDDAEQRNRLAFPFRQREDGAWASP